jgi:hypothetical protein
MHDWSWAALAGLGAFHGLNPAMGWLFAVALGMQERRRVGVLRALPPIAVGHAASIAIVAGAMVGLAASPAIPRRALAVAGGVILVAFGMWRLVRQRHPTWVGMRVGFKDLAMWSFLMASAHGAGLMLMPVLIHLDPSKVPAHAGHAMAMGGAMPSSAFAAVVVHTGAMLAVMALVALVVYETVGVAVLRKIWINLDLIWGGALIAAGIIMAGMA